MKAAIFTKKSSMFDRIPNVMRCVIWYHLYNLRNVKNTHGWVLILVKLQASASNFTEVTLLHGCFSHFQNCINGTKSRNTPQIRLFNLFFPSIVINLVKIRDPWFSMYARFPEKPTFLTPWYHHVRVRIKG